MVAFQGRGGGKELVNVALLTSEAHAQERKRVLASVRGKSTSSTPPALSREQRYNNCSTKKERATKIAPSTSRLSPQLSTDNDDDVPLGICNVVHIKKGC